VSNHEGRTQVQRAFEDKQAEFFAELERLYVDSGAPALRELAGRGQRVLLRKVFVLCAVVLSQSRISPSQRTLQQTKRFGGSRPCRLLSAP
jgi:hypothetical protein